jgi:hypothetical protein
MIKTVFLLFPCAVFLFLLRCSGNPMMAGGVETTNGFTIVASGLTVHGSAPIGSLISILPESFNPISGFNTAFKDSASIDSGKAFSFKQIRDTGTYNVFAINSSTRKGARVTSLHIIPGGYDSIVVPFDTLGEISGFAISVRNADTVAVKSLNVYCEGSNFFARTDSNGFYKMSAVPLGKYRVALVLGSSSMVGETGFEMKQFAEPNDHEPAVILNFVVK